MTSLSPSNGLGQLSRLGFISRLSLFAPPVGVAYAQLAGFDPIVGLYACIFPLLVFTLLGSPRQLIMGPDAATLRPTKRAPNPFDRFRQRRCPGNLEPQVARDVVHNDRIGRYTTLVHGSD